LSCSGTTINKCSISMNIWFHTSINHLMKHLDQLITIRALASHP
jgi:hypothetical protein